MIEHGGQKGLNLRKIMLPVNVFTYTMPGLIRTVRGVVKALALAEAEESQEPSESLLAAIEAEEGKKK